MRAVSSATGKASINYQGFDVSGTFVFIARKADGSIVSPYSFDLEEEFTNDGDDRVYLRKTLIRGAALPVITISTASGTAELLSDQPVYYSLDPYWRAEIILRWGPDVANLLYRELLMYIFF